MSESEDLVGRLTLYVKSTLYGTSLLFIIMTMLSAPILTGFFHSPEYFTYALFGILGWSVYFSQDYAYAQINDEGNPFSGESGYIEGALAAFYYNGIIFFAVVFAISTSMAGYPVVALFVAFGYPIYDTNTTARALPISFGGIAAVVVIVLARLGIRTIDALESSPTFSLNLLNRFKQRNVRFS